MIDDNSEARAVCPMPRANQGGLRGAEVPRGFTLIELMIVVTVIIAISAIAIAQFLHIMYNAQLRSSAAAFADLTQQARMGAARANATYPIRFRTMGGLQQIYIDLNNNSSWDAN